MPQDIRSFAPEHAYRHVLGEDGRESLAHMLIFPEHGIAGFVYPTVRADGLAKGRACVFGPALAEPILEHAEARVPADMDFGDWTVGPLHMAVREPHRRVDLSWHGRRIRFDGRYEALYPAYAFSSHPDGNPPYYGDDRTEQHGRITGDLEVDGKTFAIDSFMVRDHSWGPRIWGLNQHYKWLHAVTDSTSVHLFEMQSFGRTELRGYLFKDGRMRHVAEAKYDIVYDDDMMHRRLRVTVTDTEGRSALVDGRAFAHYQFDVDPMVFLNEAPMTVTVDDRAGTGWCEFCWNRNYLEFARRYVKRYG